ncbi:MAG: hypothetical protein KGV59_03945 [Tenacibaculum sp.]|nr:hypothetical protein [Tenacibaculum sp.]
MKDLEITVKNVKNGLLKDSDSILYGKIEDPIEFKDNLDDFKITDEHKHILEIFNGGRFGVIDIWDYEFMPTSQFRVIDSSYYEFGQILYEPLFIDYQTKNVVYSSQEYENVPDINLNLCDFLKFYVFGKDYLRLVNNDTNDDWYVFLKNNIFV